MQIKDQDFRLVAASQKLGWLTRILAEMETDFASKRLKGVTIDRPVFVTGLARSGTTIILTLLSKADDVATHKYRDFPFLQTPMLWNWFQDKFSKPAAPTERAHGDRIEVSGESPEAYEEPVWSAYLDWLHDPSRVHTLEAGFSHAQLGGTPFTSWPVRTGLSHPGLKAISSAQRSRNLADNTLDRM